ncbi:MAG: four helix bundle protein [Deltaproteobacteria bacterium]|nr:four helix bundle protein [Deltaproteobacteria bacterium]
MNHHRLKCYSLLVEKVAKMVPELTRRIPRGEGYLIDQFKRALTSAILNLAEGNGRTSSKERNRFFDISLGSISETIACIDIFEAFGEIPESLTSEICSNLKIAYVMIRNLKR